VTYCGILVEFSLRKFSSHCRVHSSCRLCIYLFHMHSHSFYRAFHVWSTPITSSCVCNCWQLIYHLLLLILNYFLPGGTILISLSFPIPLFDDTWGKIYGQAWIHRVLNKNYGSSTCRISCREIYLSWALILTTAMSIRLCHRESVANMTNNCFSKAKILVEDRKIGMDIIILMVSFLSGF